MKKFYKKVDMSIFKYGTTIPKDDTDIFVLNEEIKLGSSRKITIFFEDKQYPAELRYVNRKNGAVYQIRWSNRELLNSLKKTFIQTYIAIESQKIGSKNKNYVTKLVGDKQEILLFKIKDAYNVELEPFTTIPTLYDNLFKKLVDNNVFFLMDNSNKSNKKYDTFIQKISKWYSIKELKNHVDIMNVIYYLIDDINKKIYIGSANRLGDRVKEGRREIPNWNRFRYEIIKPKYYAYLRSIEYHAIMNFATFFKNTKGLNSAELSEYTLVNKDYQYYLK